MTLTRSVVGTAATWTGQVTVPADDGELRLLVVEEERLFADSPDNGAEVVTSPGSSTPPPSRCDVRSIGPGTWTRVIPAPLCCQPVV